MSFVVLSSGGSRSLPTASRSSSKLAPMADRGSPVPPTTDGVGPTRFLALPPNPLDTNPLDDGSWLYHAAHFATRSRTLRMDLAGYDHNPRLSGPVTLSELADVAYRAVDAEEVERAVIAGVSIGSRLALGGM